LDHGDKKAEMMIRTLEKTRSVRVRDPEQRYWEACKARDRSFDGTFFYSVATTGVYCRPSCAARLAKRENVAFHATCRDAEAAGFRPCKRCKPNEPSLHDRYAAMVVKICHLIEGAEEPPRLDELATAAGLSTYHFHRVFKAIAGVTARSGCGKICRGATP
jgi:AraC family transcriptional regulator of adaptative response/methylated-DNA-[protein]-cysteine methyltransferase